MELRRLARTQRSLHLVVEIVKLRVAIGGIPRASCGWLAACHRADAAICAPACGRPCGPWRAGLRTGCSGSCTCKAAVNAEPAQGRRHGRVGASEAAITSRKESGVGRVMRWAFAVGMKPFRRQEGRCPAQIVFGGHRTASVVQAIIGPLFASDHDLSKGSRLLSPIDTGTPCPWVKIPACTFQRKWYDCIRFLCSVDQKFHFCVNYYPGYCSILEYCSV